VMKLCRVVFLWFLITVNKVTAERISALKIADVIR
jgi:hypothetical protein